MSCDIINRLFELDFDEILQKVFLSLDPLSLKNCKCVSKGWFNFIQRRLWESKPARTQLYKRLINQWKFSDPFSTVHDEGVMGVNYLASDDEMVVCGYTTGYARAYNLHTGELLHQLQCNKEDNSDYDGVQLELGKTVIVTVTETGWVTVFCRTEGKKLYQEKHHGEHKSVYGLKVTGSCVLTGGGDGSLVMMEMVEGVWRVTDEMFENKEGITHIDVDGKWAVTGTRQSIKLWDLEQHKLVVGGGDKVKTKVWMLSLTFPHVFVVGGDDWPGVQVWNITTGHLVRHVDNHQGGKPFHNIHHNGRFLTISEYNTNTTWRGQTDKELEVIVYDGSELLDTKIDSKNLWKKSLEYSPGEPFEQINAVSNQTCLVVAHGSFISILNFWKDRIVAGQHFSPDGQQYGGDFPHEEEEGWDTEEWLTEDDGQH